MNDPRGSLWRKWDLHVHTPASIHHNYGHGEEAWEKFISDLEALPPAFSVIGVNDYVFVDGYKRLLLEKAQNGRLKNIDLLLPVIELRLDKFCGTQHHLQRLNYHIIFSSALSAETIQSQFINALSAKYTLSPEYQDKVEWKSLPTRESLIDLGNRLKDVAPLEKKVGYGDPLLEGFNNLALSLGDIEGALDKPFFQDAHLRGVGKAEWASLHWQDGSIAEKRNIINGVALVFTASVSPGAYRDGRKKLTEQGVNDRLLDCSDAHNFAASGEKDRIGNCFTWIKADPTFEGLKHALKEFEARVFIGDEPEEVTHVKANKTKYIQSVRLEKRAESTTAETWFGDSIPLNPSLVAVIGRKGSGKSALTDALGLLGDSRNEDHFGFLNPTRFRDPRDNKAREYAAAMTWETGVVVERALDQAVSQTSVETVKYIPQSFLEAICNPKGGQETDFDRELKNVIFSHVEKADRLECASLDELISLKSGEKEDTLAILKRDLFKLNLSMAELEAKNLPEYRASVESELRTREAELKAHDDAKPSVQQPPPEDVAAQSPALRAVKDEIDAKRRELEQVRWEIARAQGEQSAQALAAEAADRALAKLRNFKLRFDELTSELIPDLLTLGLTISQVVTFDVNEGPVKDAQSGIQLRRSAADAALDPENVEGVAAKQKFLAGALRSLQEQLDEPTRKYETYLGAMESWRSKRAMIVGDPSTSGTVQYFRSVLAELDEAPAKLAALEQQRTAKTTEIFRTKLEIAKVYEQLYEPVRRFIDEHSFAKDALQLNFEVSIVQDGFVDRFLRYIDQGNRGSFYGRTEGRRLVEGLVEKRDFNTEADPLAFVAEVTDHLRRDKRPGSSETPTAPAAQLVSRVSVSQVYDLIFGLDYLTPRYALRMGQKQLNHLSAGEKGSLLLIFFLLIDKGTVPLVIDQPEENLDNETVFNLLVPCIRDAKKKRQIIIVTHNPNLAVVCDAEQIVHASEDKSTPKRITYTSGAIENPAINKKILDVLEGTRPAFENRESKYLPG